jgi:DNA-binding GntR family transcriptional regulator
MMALAPIGRRSTEAVVRDRLTAAIVAGTYPPGTRLTEQSLADQLAISRATVRSALQAVAAEGLVTLVPYTGWKVIDLTAADAWELVSLRAALEPFAARLAAERSDAAQRAAVAEAFARLERAVRARSSTAATAADAAFHLAIVDAAGHGRLADQYRRMAAQFTLLIASSNLLLPDARTLLAQHQPIRDAILGGRAGAADVAMRRHVETEGATLITHLGVLSARASEPRTSRSRSRRSA